MQDIVIIGAGITGCFLAHDLSKYQLKITVFDKENDVANATTMANSAIIHAGHDPKEGTLKAVLNQRGARMYPQICRDLQVEYQICGAYVVAHDEDEIQILKDLKKRADGRGIDARFVSPKELLAQEPNVADEIIQALEIPQTAVVNPWQCATALMEEAVLNGVHLKLGSEVIGIDAFDDYFIVHTDQGEIMTKVIINAAGCGCEKIAAMIEEPPFHITYKKGEYFVLSKLAKDFVHHVIYPVPSKLGKGVLAVPTTHGNILLGPNNTVCESEDVSTTQNGMDTVRERLAYIVKNVPYGEIIRSYSGIRPSGNQGDFYIQPSQTYDRLLHVACIDSPGLASAPAISEYVIQKMVQPLLPLQPKMSYVRRKAPIVMEHLSVEEKNRFIRQNPAYGQIICKCENISYQEIVDAIHGPCGAKTIKAVKKRVRAGMGKCQGGICESAVAKILAKELQIPLADVLYDAPGSELGTEAKRCKR